jgi:hypothetical protein
MKRISMENKPASPPSFGKTESENQASFNLLLSLTDTRETQILIRRKLARQSASLPSLNSQLMPSLNKNDHKNRITGQEIRRTFNSEKEQPIQEEDDEDS